MAYKSALALGQYCHIKTKKAVVRTVTQCTLKFIYSEKATKFYEIFTLFLSYVAPVKSKVKIAQNFVTFSEYMNFNVQCMAKRRLSHCYYTVHTVVGSGLSLD